MPEPSARVRALKLIIKSSKLYVLRNVSNCSVPGTESSQPFLDLFPLSGGAIAVLKGASFHRMLQM